MQPSPTIPRWQNVLLAIYRTPEEHRYCEKLHRIIKGSRRYLSEVVRQLVEQGLIEILPSAKIKRLVLTDKGKKVIASLLEMRTHLNVM